MPTTILAPTKVKRNGMHCNWISCQHATIEYDVLGKCGYLPFCRAWWEFLGMDTNGKILCCKKCLNSQVIYGGQNV